MDRRGGRPQVAQQTIGASAATPEQAKLLRIKPGSPLVTMVRTGFALDGTRLEYSENVYRADKYAFEITLHSR